MNTLDYKTIGSKIRERRRSLGLKQEYIAGKLDVNPSHISNIECGRANPSLSILVYMANILQCSVDRFLSGEYDYNPPEKSSVDERIEEKLRYMDETTKEKLLKIMEIL